VGIAAVAIGSYRYNSSLATYLRDREFAAVQAANTAPDKDNGNDQDLDLDELLRLNRTQMQAYQSLLGRNSGAPSVPASSPFSSASLSWSRA
jgi:hypothetical protein